MYNIKTILAHPDKSQLRIMSEIMRNQSNATARIEILTSCEEPESLYQAIFRFAPDLIIVEENLLTPCINVLAGKCEIIAITENRSAADSSNVHYAYVPVQPPELIAKALDIFAMITEEDYKNRETQVPSYLQSLGLPQKYCSAIDAFCYENRILTRNGVTPFAQRKRVMDSIVNGALPLERVKQRHSGTAFDPETVYSPYAMRFVDDIGEVQSESIFAPIEDIQAVHPVDVQPIAQTSVQAVPPQMVIQPPQATPPAYFQPPAQSPQVEPPVYFQPSQAEPSAFIPSPEPAVIVVEPSPVLTQPEMQEAQIDILAQHADGEPKQHLEFLRNPCKTQFVAGEKIRKEDLLVKLVEPDGGFVLVRDFDLYPNNPVTENDTEIQITYKGLTLSYPISVVDKVVMAVVIQAMPKKLDYVCGVKELDLTGGMLVVFFSDATNMQVDITPDMIEGFDGNKVGRQIVNVCFRDKKLPMQITVRNKNIVKVEAISQPNKKEYTEGEKLDTAGLVLRVIYDNGDEDFVTDYECPDIRVQKDEAVIEMDYKGNIFPVFVHVRGCVVTGIRMETLPEKLCYLEKRDMLEIAGGQVAKILSNGDTEIVPLEMHMISGFNNQRVGLCKVIVNLDDFQCFFEVQIVEREVVRLEVIHKPHKTVYFEQELFEPEGLEIKAQYNNNTFERIEGFEYEPAVVDCGTSAVSISYRGKSVDVPVQVQMRMVESVSIAKMPDKMHFKEGMEQLDVSGGKLLVIFNNGSADTIDMYENMVEGFDNMKAGDNLLTVRYQDKTTQYHVVIDPKVLIGISIIQMPDKTVYQRGDIADLAGMKLVGFYDNSVMTEIEHYAYQPNGILQMEDTAIIVSYMDKIAIVPITVAEQIEEPEPEIEIEPALVIEPERSSGTEPITTQENAEMPEIPCIPVIEAVEKREFGVPADQLAQIPLVIEGGEPEVLHAEKPGDEPVFVPEQKDAAREMEDKNAAGHDVEAAALKNEMQTKMDEEMPVDAGKELAFVENILDSVLDDKKHENVSETRKPKNVRFYAGTGDLRFKNDENYKMFA